MEPLFEAFCAHMDDAAHCLRKLETLLSDGKVPPQEQVSAFDDAVNLLWQSYEALCRAAERLLPEEELPEAQALKDGTDGPGAILAAIECENKDADQGLALCDRVADYYPGHVYTGVVADKYYIDAEILKAVQAQANALAGALLSAAGGSLSSARILLYAFAEQTFAPYTADQ